MSKSVGIAVQSTTVLGEKRGHARHGIATWMLIAPAVAYLLAVFAVPLAHTVWTSISDPTIGFGNYVPLFTDPFYLLVYARTIGVAGTVTILCLLMGFPLAHYMARKGGLVNLFGGPPAGTTVKFDTNLLHYSDLTLKASFHHTPATARRAFDLLRSGRFRCRRSGGSSSASRSPRPTTARTPPAIAVWCSS